MPRPKKKNEHLPYGEGQREQYGEGFAYRKHDLSKGADKVNDLGGFAGGARPKKSVPDPEEPEGD
ncbi:hypothetical protein W911_13430 [Hyphomicrobium nitrativorans NL23]|uniref:Uncharacterized protein n=1 Tax=Hyphomicrobium nitrativorans NL23 TaxID=1029756 RepID=V5SJZ1_9HYPH|nr:hypothetical protein [Hyphomicrobium nitrativorans]AHB50289.1 hypothetical protein W911_13430 [Hyphomicrobium nitrativorans NL23]